MKSKRRRQKRHQPLSSEEESSSEDGSSCSRTQQCSQRAAGQQLYNSRTIHIQQQNPKQPGSQCHARYERYKAARTIGAVLACGGTKADIKGDLQRGFIVLQASKRRNGNPVVDVGLSVGVWEHRSGRGM